MNYQILDLETYKRKSHFEDVYKRQSRCFSINSSLIPDARFKRYRPFLKAQEIQPASQNAFL